jgi:hypothetical protein
MKIICYGASLTTQKNGYAVYLKKLFGDDYEVSQISYAGMALCNAGVIFVDEVIKQKPDICFVDWFSPAYEIVEPSYLDTLIYKFHEINCKPIFLFFDHAAIQTKMKTYNFSKRYAEEHNICYIELHDKFDKKEILRDHIHTTDEGSSKYAEEIYRVFNETISAKIFEPTYTYICPEKNVYCSMIRKLDINKIITNEIVFKGFAKILGIYQNVGPFTGVLDYKWCCRGLQCARKENIWDGHCYYVRPNMKIMIEFHDYFKIKITNEDFDRSLARQQVDWPEQKLDFIAIYYIGDMIIESIDGEPC